MGMTVFSSLQTLAEKYEETNDDDAWLAFQSELMRAWPLLEAAVKAAMEIEPAVICTEECPAYWTDPAEPCTCGGEERVARFEAALFSLTGEPR